jgi:hypothetical protein
MYNSLFNIVKLVDEMVTMLRVTINQNVAIIPNLPTEILSINGDENQIRQVVYSGPRNPDNSLRC